MSKPRVIVFDIETLYMHLASFDLRQENYGIDNVLEEWSICSFAAKVVGSKECLRIDTAGSRNDKRLIKKAIKFLNTADVLVSQNGIGFDLPKINSRAEINKLGPNTLHRKMHVDLLRQGRALFGHTSHKLAWVSKMLTPQVQKSRHSNFEGIDLWKEVEKRNPSAIKEMNDYNWQDVLATEAVYNQYIQWFDKVDLNVSVGPKPKPFSVACRVCSGQTVSNGSVRRVTGLYRKYLCKSCGSTTTPTGAGFNLDVAKKAITKLAPNKLELERLRTSSKVLAKKLQESEARVLKLIKSRKELK